MRLNLERLSPRSTRVTLGEVTVLFSYETAVAFTMPLMNWIVDPTKYSKTTTRHINAAIPKDWQAPALNRENFETALEKALGGYGVRDVIFFALGEDR